MNDKQSNASTHPDDHDGTSFVDLLMVAARSKRLIIGLPFIAALITFVIAFLIPPTYRASVTLLPPQQAQTGAAALLSQLGGAAGIVAGAAGLKNPGDVYIAMLKSRTVADSLIKQFDLQKAYEVDSVEQVRKELERNTSVNASKEGLITITVDDGDKARVAKLANAYVDELVKLTRVLAVTEAAQRRLFFEQQLEQAKNKLTAAEVKLKSGLEKNGIISVDADSRASVEMVARMRAQATAKEIQLNAMRSFVTSNNQHYKVVQQELSSLQAELSRLENGRGTGTPSADKTFAGLDNIKTLREVKYQQMLYELLAKQYEAARLDEARDSSVIQTLDPAIVPEKQFAPKPLRLAVISALLAFFGALTLVYARDAFVRSTRTSAAAGKWSEFRSQLKQDR